MPKFDYKSDYRISFIIASATKRWNKAIDFAFITSHNNLATTFLKVHNKAPSLKRSNYSASARYRGIIAYILWVTGASIQDLAIGHNSWRRQMHEQPQEMTIPSVERRIKTFVLFTERLCQKTMHMQIVLTF